MENAEVDARFWEGHHGLLEANAKDQRGLAATAEKAAEDNEAAAADARAHADQAKERIERLKRGEAVTGGLGRPMTREDFERVLGKDFVRRGLLFASLTESELSELKNSFASGLIDRAAHRAPDIAPTTSLTSFPARGRTSGLASRARQGRERRMW